MPPQNYLTSGGYFGLGIETTFDTPVTPGFWIPYQTPKWDPDLKWLMDESIVGSPTVTRDAVPGVRKDMFNVKHYMYMDSIGNFLRAIFGGVDTVTGSGPFTHTIKLLNNNATASQTPSYTLDYYDSSQTRQMAGARLKSFDITWTADGTLECQSDWVSMPETDIGAPTQTPSTAHFVPGWGVNFSLGGVATATLLSGTITLTRVGTDAIFTAANTPNPHNIFAGPMQIKGKAKALVEASTFNFITNSLSRDQLAQIVTFTEPVSGNTLALTMTASQFMKPVLDPSKKWLIVDVDFEAIGNTTDATSGISPGAAVLVNAQSSPY